MHRNNVSSTSVSVWLSPIACISLDVNDFSNFFHPQTIFGDVKNRQGARRIKRRAKLRDVYAVVRKRADHAATRVSGTRFVRYIILVLTLDEYNLNHDTLSLRAIRFFTAK